jgi:hypothetical protein
MSNYKPGDVVATVFQPWSKALVKKIKGDKAYVYVWVDYGFFGRFFPLQVRAVPLTMIIPYVDERPDFPGPCEQPVAKPPVSEPAEEGNKPL